MYKREKHFLPKKGNPNNNNLCPFLWFLNLFTFLNYPHFLIVVDIHSLCLHWTPCFLWESRPFQAPGRRAHSSGLRRFLEEMKKYFFEKLIKSFCKSIVKIFSIAPILCNAYTFWFKQEYSIFFDTSVEKQKMIKNFLPIEKIIPDSTCFDLEGRQGKNYKNGVNEYTIVSKWHHICTPCDYYTKWWHKCYIY